SEEGLIWPTIEPITHVYASINVYTVTVRIDGEACPEARPGFASQVMYVGVTRPLDKRIYLPLVLKNYRGGVIAYSEPPTQPSDAETELPVVGAPINEPAAASTPPTRSANAPAAPQAASAVTMPPNTVKVTDSPLGVDSQPAINNDGSRIAFWSTGRHGAANADGNIEIFMARDGTAYPLQLTDSRGTILGGFNLGPSINGAGNHVAFFSDQDLLGANSTGAQVILSNTGQLLEQKNRDRNFEIFMAEIDGSQVSLLQLTNTTGGESILPSMSDNGHRIAFASSIDLTDDMQRRPGIGIFVAEITRTQGITWNVGYTCVVTPVGANDQPSISGDGRFVAFVSDQDLVPGNNAAPNNNREIFVAELESDQVKRYIQVTQTPEGMTNEQPSIVARKTPTETALNVIFLSDYDWPDDVDNANYDRHVALAVITLTADANLPPIIDVYAVPQTPGEKDYPTISTDGGRIAYISTADQKLHLYDTIEGRDIAENAPVQHAFPALSADGTQMAFVANWDIYRGEYPLVDLALVKSANTSEAEATDTVTYVFTATNTGPSPAIDVKIVDILPEGMQAQITPVNPNNYRDAGASGFSANNCGGCVHHGTDWNSTAQALTIFDFSGRVFPLPDRNDTSAGAQWTNMQDNELLMHMESVPPVDVNTKNMNRAINVQGTPSVVSGKIGNALAFNGSAAVGVLDVLNTAGTGATASWMTWVRMDSTSPGGLMAEVESPWDGWGIDFPSSSQIRFRGSNHFNLILSLVTEKTVMITPQVGEWFHLAVTWRDSTAPNDIRIYINGREITGGGLQYPALDEFNIPINTLHIGRDQRGNFFRGALDEVAIFSRILTADEILAVYERQSPAYTAYFDSALMQETTGSNAWSTLAWYPSLPVGVELPDNGANWTISETQTLANSGYRYPTATLAMSGTMLLLHMNETSGATSFFDTSGVRDAQGYRNEAYCDGERCPQTTAGRFNGALRFDGSDDYIYVREPKDFAATEMTVMFWLRTQQSSGGLFQYSVTDSPSADDGKWRFQENEFTISGPGGLQVYLGGQIYNSAVAVNDGEWHHIAVTWDDAARTIAIYRDGVIAQTIASVITYTLTPPHNDGRFTARAVLGNRLGYTYEQGQECVWVWWEYFCYPTYVYSLKEVSQAPFDGTLDELAVFKRALNTDEVRAAYLRGTARMLFQVRTCATSACNGANEFFVGPGGLRHTYYTDEPDSSTPLWSLAGLPSLPYLQYRTYMDGFIPNHTPELITVTVRPRAECGTNAAKSVITCTLSTRESPLPVYETVGVHVPVYVTSNAFSAANLVDGQLAIQNQARILAVEADHYQANNTDSWPLTLKPISITAVSISPASPAWEVNQTGYLTATLTPGNTTPSVWYEWTAPLYGTQLYTVTTDWLNHTVAYSYTEVGTRTITVRARNTPGDVWQTASVLVKINHPKPHIDALTPNEADAYSPQLTITIDGDDFVDDGVTRVLWNGVPLATSNVINSTQMTALIPAANLTLGGGYPVTVRNAQAGLDTQISNAATITVYNRVPTVNNVTPVSTMINTATPVVINGDYFATSGAIVRLYRPNGTTVDLTPSAATRTQINVTIPGSNIQAAGYYSLTVQNPTPYRATGESTKLLFTVYNP
ncbi:MAG: PD40 domain-containing protein, partial [Anaerolineae bacterium]|nr:PD40 domain-containing protein [Anaerolineae bacterium]